MKNQTTLIHFLDGVGVAFSDLELLVRRRSRKYDLRLFLHADLGKILVLDGEIQHVENWAMLYHETLIHVPAAFIPIINTVAILGGGSLFAATEALKYNSVQHVIMFDHDRLVFETIAEFYPHAQACLADPRLEIIDRDAYAEIRKRRGMFDLIVNDATDLLSINIQKSRSSIFGEMARSLKPKGACADVIQRHIFERLHIRDTLRGLRRLKHAFSLTYIPEYHGALHILAIWGKETSLISQKACAPSNREQRLWSKTPDHGPCSFYDSRFLPYYLHLPRYLRSTIRLKEKVA